MEYDVTSCAGENDRLGPMRLPGRPERLTGGELL